MDMEMRGGGGGGCKRGSEDKDWTAGDGGGGGEEGGGGEGEGEWVGGGEYYLTNSPLPYPPLHEPYHPIDRYYLEYTLLESLTDDAYCLALNVTKFSTISLYS